MKNISLLVLATMLMIATTIQAKWASFDDAPTKITRSSELKVNSDGTTQETVETQVEILKESGRDIAAHPTLIYNDDSTKIKIIDAKTIFNGKEYKLDKNLIEDKPLASSPYGFDQTRQIMLAFPKVEVGAKIYLKYQVIVTKVSLDNFFASLYFFGDGMFTAKDRIKLHSQLPLHLIINDPENALKITKDRTDNFHTLEVTLTKPLYKALTNEPATNIVNNKHLTWISISSLNKWEELAGKLSALYTIVLNQPLPKEFAKIAKVAAQKKGEVEQINTVTSMLNDKIQYLGDWRSIKGRFVSRNQEEVSNTQMGDCKDFASATATILTSLGYKAQIALVRRGVHEFYPDTLPDIAAFNHAFVKVTNKQGKVYWIDPTNFQSMADGMFPDVANKKVLVLDSQHPTYEKTPNQTPDHAEGIFTNQIEIINNNKIAEHGTVTLKNEEALNLTGVALSKSEKSIKDMLFYNLSGTTLEEKNKKSMKLPALNSRIVKDITYNYSFEQYNRLTKTNLGLSFSLRYGALANLFGIAQDYVADIAVDSYTWTAKSRTLIKNIKVRNIESLNKKITSPWIYVARTCTLINNHDLQIDEVLVLLKNLIPNEETKSAEFIKMQNSLEQNFKNIAVVFTPQ